MKTKQLVNYSAICEIKELGYEEHVTLIQIISNKNNPSNLGYDYNRKVREDYLYITGLDTFDTGCANDEKFLEMLIEMERTIKSLRKQGFVTMRTDKKSKIKYAVPTAKTLEIVAIPLDNITSLIVTV